MSTRQSRKKPKEQKGWNKEYSEPTLMTGTVAPQQSVSRLFRTLKKTHGFDFYNATVVDFGCGTGRASIDMVDRGARVFGFDGSSVAIDQAKKQAQAAQIEPSPTFKHLEWSEHSKLPQESESVDLVLINMVLHLLSPAARSKALQEIGRVLKTNGFCIIRTLAIEGDANAKKLIEQFPSSQEPNTYIMPELKHAEHVFTKEELAGLFGAEGSTEHAWNICMQQKHTGYPRFQGVTYKRQYWELIVQKT